VKVKDFELVDLGIDNSQYFQGFGCAFTPYTDCAVGIGDTPAEAFEDCLDQAAEMGVDTEDLEARIREEWGKVPDTPSVSEEYPDSEDTYYHIGVRWNV